MKAYRCLCGSKPQVYKVDKFDGDYIVRCAYCGTKSPSMGRGEDDAIKEWNDFIHRVLSK